MLSPRLLRLSVALALVGALLAGIPAAATAATTPPTSASGPPIDEYSSVLGATFAGVGGSATCDYSGTGWTGFDSLNDYVSGYAWYRDGSAITGETGYSYTVVQADGGHSLTCKNQVTWDHTVASGDPADTGTTALGLASSALVIPTLAKATNSVAPAISPDPAQTGDFLVCDPGTWDDPYATASYVWTRDGTPIPAETQSYYTVHYADEGKAIVCVVTVENPGVTPGTLVSDPASSQTVTPTAGTPPVSKPVIVTAPAITPTTLYVGDVATCDGGTWDDPLSTLAFTWTSGGATVGTNSYQHTVADADKDKPLVCTVTATNPVGTSDPSASNPVTPVVKVPPTVVTPPSLYESQLFVGDVAHCDPGTWSDPYATPTYAWTSGGSPVGTDSWSYTVVAGDAGKALVCTVTVTGAQGTSLPSSSAPVTPTTPAAPANTVAPTVSGTSPAYPGDSLYCENGTWSGDALVFTYAWYADTTKLAETTGFYDVVGGDVGKTITCRVTATNVTDTQEVASSNGVPVIALANPANTVPPTLDPAGAPGDYLYCDSGTWTGGQITISRTWKRDDGPLAETSSSYVVVLADVGHTISCTVTADNPLHHPASVDSPSARIVATGTPYPSSRPSISPSALARTETASCYPGYWYGPTVVFSYTWLLDGSEVGTGSHHLVVTGDVGHVLVCRVTGSLSGSPVGTYDSLPVTPTPLTTPVNTGLPTTLTGDPLVPTATLSCDAGSWTGGALSYRFGWKRDGTTIPGALLDGYVVAKADVGHALTCVVTASNAAGHADASSAATAAIAALPVPTLSQPSIDPGSDVTAGTVLSCDVPPTDVPARITITWKLNDSAIADEQGTSYVVRRGDAGGTITCSAIATDTAGSSAAQTSAGVAVAAAAVPASLTAPSVRIDLYYSTSGVVGDRLHCSSRFSQAPTAYAYVWKRGATPIPGATHRFYDTVAADGGTTLTCEVTATNPTGSSTPAAASAGFPVASLAIPTAPDKPTLYAQYPQPTGIAVCFDPSWVGVVDTELVRWLVNGSAIADEHGSAYRIRTGDVGKAIRCELTAYNGAGPSAAIQSDPVSVVALAIPTTSDIPSLSGLAMPTQPEYCQSPLWVGIVDSLAFVWKLDGSSIAGATDAAYTPASGDVGHQLTCTVTATNGAGTSAPVTSDPVTVVALIAPYPQFLPIVPRQAEPGETIHCNTQFSPEPATETDLVRRDDGTVVASGTSYTVVAADAGHELRCDLTGTNSAGSNELVSAGVWVTDNRIPTPYGLPVQDEVDVTYAVGQTASCHAPYSIEAATSSTEGWKLGDAATVDGGDHGVTDGDLAGTLRCIGSATNAAGTGHVSGPALVTEAATAPYGGAGAFGQALAWVGDTLTCASSSGDWHGGPPTSLARTWSRGTSALMGQAGETYTTVTADGNHGIGCTVQGVNAVGPGETALVRPIWVLPAEAPYALLRPFTSSSEVTYPGQDLYCYAGMWGGGGITFSYTWRRAGTTIVGETGATYTATTADVGKLVGCVVKAHNGLGDVTIVTTPARVSSPPPQTDPPVNIAAPSIAGTPTIGSTLTCDHGQWSNFPATFAVVWKRGSQKIAGATGDTYKVAKADAGFAITCSVTATNEIGPATAASAAVAVAPTKPVNVVAPKLGKLAVGKRATVSKGTWVGAPVITFKYQWYRGSTKIKGATKSAYKVTKADKGKRLSCRITAKDSVGSTTKATKAVKVP